MNSVVIDTNKLKGAIKAKGLTQGEFAAQIGICEQTLSKKLKVGRFDSNEMYAMIKLLDLKDPASIFFVDEVAQ